MLKGNEWSSADAVLNRREPRMKSKNRAPRKSALSLVATIGLDLAKSSVDCAGLDATG